MTACVNRKHTKKVAAVVTASLVGALSLGAAPVAAMADTGIDLQFLEPTGAFEGGDVEATFNVSGMTYDSTAKTPASKTYDGAPVALDTVEVTMIGGVTEGDTFKVDFHKNPADVCTVEYFTRDANGDPADPVEDPTDAGKYVAVVTVVEEGPYKGATVSVPFNIDAIDISNISIVGETQSMYDAEPKDLTFYIDKDGKTGFDEDGDLELYVGSDIDVQWYYTGHDLTDEHKADSVLEEGEYRAEITGKGNFKGSKDLNKGAVTVLPLDLESNDVYIPAIYSVNGAEPKAPEEIFIEGVRHDSSSPIISELKAELDKNSSVDTIWYANGDYKYVVTKAVANDHNIDGKYVMDAHKLSEEVVFSYDGEAVEGEYDIFIKDAENSFNDNKLTAKDSKDTVYKCNNASNPGIKLVAVIDEYGDNAAGTQWWTRTGNFTAIYEVNNNGIGGQLIVNVHNYVDAINADATAAVIYDGKVVSSINAVYDSEVNLADEVKVVVEDEGGNDVSDDCKVTWYDADGQRVHEVKNAGTYVLKVTSDSYKLSGTTEMEVTVAPRDLTSTKVSTLSTVEWDNVGNKTEYLPWRKTKGYTIDGLGLKYLVPGGDADEETDWANVDMKDIKVTIVDASGEQIDRIDDEGVYTIHFEARNEVASGNYILPSDLTVTCIKDGNNADKVNHLQFADVEYTDYFANAVSFVANEHFMTGYKGTKLFGSYDNLNRGQMAIVLYNMAKGEGKVDENGLTYTNKGGWMTGFDDVNGNEYYAKAIAWAKLSGVVNGYDDGTFGPEDPVTREQFAAMLMNYTKKFGDFEAADTSVLDEYDDANTVSDWAENSVAWGIENGILGNGGFLNAQGEIIRADAACMVYNYTK